tara:strand:- start:16388 stop:17230 length:843 start_codon:yes stop_codon:yes gene_type:complete
MESRIVFLGTGGDHHVVNKQERASAGIIIQFEGYQFHIDPGPGSLAKLKEFGINPRETTALMISHSHINHSNDANVVLSAMTLNGMDKRGVLICSPSLVNGTDKIRPMIPAHYQSFVERIILPEPDKRIGIENMEIQTLKTLHSDPYGLGFKFYTPEFVLTYVGDTTYHSELLPQYDKTDILVLNVVHPFGHKSKINLTSYDAVKIINKVKPRLTILTHFGRKLLAVDPVMEAREISRQTMSQVLAATDGMVISPSYYSASSRQKTLQSYSQQQRDAVTD